MEAEIVNKLHFTHFEATGAGGGGCISSGSVYKTERGNVFVKKNNKTGSNVMFNGEYHGLSALAALGFPVPKPLLAGENYLVMEYVDIMGLDKFATELGTKLAELHQSEVPTNQFGFDCPTSCGFIPMNNEWSNDWVQFFACNRLKPHIDSLTEANGDRELNELWSDLQIVVSHFFKDIEVKPSLLHGDLWSGNVGETATSPVAFDPAAFYGHAEYDLAIANMFGGFPRRFTEAYHSKLPKAPGFEDRQNLYQLFHNLNHWSHFGAGYRGSSLSLMRRLIARSRLKNP